MRIYGADVSHWEGNINWGEAVKFLPFVYYKATDGMYYIDSQFGNNHDECNEVGIPHAPFHWWQELQDPIIQANHFCDTLEDSGDGYKREIVDVEPQVQASSVKLKQLLDRIEQRRGRKPAIYTSSYYWSMVTPTPTWAYQYDLLVAQYAYRTNPILPVGWSTWKIWQFTDKFWFHGCNEIADGNWFNGDLTACRNWFGNYHPYNLPPPTSSDEIKPIKYIYVNADALNLRSLPTVNGLDIGTVKYNDDLGIIEEKDGWLHVEGWISKAYTRPK